MSFLLITNPEAGSREEDALLAEAKERLADVETLELVPDVDLGTAISAAVRDERVVVAAGGDGTVNEVAQHLVGRGTLGVLPGGTLNHFARDLGVRDPHSALVALERGRVRKVDVGKAGSRIFVNNAGLGLYPDLVRERGNSSGLLGTSLAAGIAAFRVLKKAQPLVGSITADGDERMLSAWIVFLGNNRFSAAPGRLGQRARLDEGVLDVRVLTAGPRKVERTYLAYGVLRGRPWKARRLVRTDARKVQIDLAGRPRLISRDGETGERASVLTVEMVPRALSVLAPPDSENPAS